MTQPQGRSDAGYLANDPVHANSPSGYLSGFGTRVTPQDEPMPGQVPNNAGGHVWAVDEWARLARFLVLGSEGGTYYASQHDITKENVDGLRKAIANDGRRAVELIASISEAGRAPKNTPAVFALALAASADDPATRQAALDALPRVCRIPTHLFEFLGYAQENRGWGRGLRKAVGAWYGKDVEQLAYQVIKYRQRAGWTHRDVLRSAHPKAATPEHARLFAWIAGKSEEAGLRHVEAFLRAQEAPTPAATVALVHEYGDALPREALLPAHLTDPGVWAALVDVGMPMTALIRNLANMTRIGLLKPLGGYTATVTAQIQDETRLRKARVHPIQVLAALATYGEGHGARGDNEWQPVAQVVDALDRAFYLSFGNVEATGKRIMLALDVSGSMSWSSIAGVPGLTPRVGSAAMALVTAATEPNTIITAFSHQLVPVSISPRQRLDDALKVTGQIQMGGTDCSLPMTAALEQSLEVDGFIVYTDSETWAGRINPAQALQLYRQKTGIHAKLAVVGMVSNGFTIADPNDAGMLDVVGFDTATPNLLGDFIGPHNGRETQ